MLHEFLDSHRTELIGRCRVVAGQPAPTGTPAAHGIPLFLDQLIRTLRVEQKSGALRNRVDRAGAVRRAGGDTVQTDTSEIGVTAMQYGLELSKRGVTIDQVVHDYGDLCQAITGLAGETRTAIDVGEFKTLNRCLDDAIAGAVTEFCYQQDSALADQNMQASDERVRTLLHELQGHVQAATLAIGAVEAGIVGSKGATGAILDLSLAAMRTLIERSLADTARATGSPARH